MQVQDSLEGRKVPGQSGGEGKAGAWLGEPREDVSQPEVAAGTWEEQESILSMACYAAPRGSLLSGPVQIHSFFNKSSVIGFPRRAISFKSACQCRGQV